MRESLFAVEAYFHETVACADNHCGARIISDRRQAFVLQIRLVV